MGGMTGGGKSPKGGGGGQQMYVPPATPAPTYQYPTDTTALEAEKNKQQKALMAMQGRQSTILTDESLTAPDVTKRQLLGA